MIDVNDDLAGAKKPFKVVACIPVKGRGPLVEQTIRRLYLKNGVDKVICSGDSHEDRKVCERAGALWVQHRNQPLGQKWNAAFSEAKQYNPDACLFVGSSDWISDNWCSELSPLLQEYDMVGTPGCHFLDISEVKRLVYWPGYTGHRQWESIGIGRLLNRNILEKLRWNPFDDSLDRSLDGSMSARIKKVGGTASHGVVNNKINSLSISTNQWINKHRFEDHWSGQLKSKVIDNPDQWLGEHFPEALNVFK